VEEWAGVDIGDVEELMREVKEKMRRMEEEERRGVQQQETVAHMQHLKAQMAAALQRLEEAEEEGEQGSERQDEDGEQESESERQEETQTFRRAQGVQAASGGGAGAMRDAEEESTPRMTSEPLHAARQRYDASKVAVSSGVRGKDLERHNLIKGAHAGPQRARLPECARFYGSVYLLF
jgi:hypothetical protein